jgi:hypothetical protein
MFLALMSKSNASQLELFGEWVLLFISRVWGRGAGGQQKQQQEGVTLTRPKDMNAG